MEMCPRKRVNSSSTNWLFNKLSSNEHQVETTNGVNC